MINQRIAAGVGIKRYGLRLFYERLPSAEQIRSFMPLQLFVRFMI
jgi:hypothetical protein